MAQGAPRPKTILQGTAMAGTRKGGVIGERALGSLIAAKYGARPLARAATKTLSRGSTSIKPMKPRLIKINSQRSQIGSLRASRARRRRIGGGVMQCRPDGGPDNAADD